MRVVVPPQSVDRNDDNWLYHRTDVPESMTNHTDGGAMRASSHDLACWTVSDFVRFLFDRNMVGLMPSWNHLIRV